MTKVGDSVQVTVGGESKNGVVREVVTRAKNDRKIIKYRVNIPLRGESFLFFPWELNPNKA